MKAESEIFSMTEEQKKNTMVFKFFLNRPIINLSVKITKKDPAIRKTNPRLFLLSENN